jgi:hypothetical protein
MGLYRRFDVGLTLNPVCCRISWYVVAFGPPITWGGVCWEFFAPKLQ